MIIRDVAEALLNLIFPRRATCLGCGDMCGCDRNELCEECRRKLAESWVGLRMPPRRSHIDGMAFVHYYHGPAAGAVQRLKYGGVWLLSEEMGAEIGRAAELLRIENICYVAAAPMHKKRLLRRGKNHAELLARHAAERLGLEYVDLLMRTRNAVQQARLSPGERMQNLKGVFEVRPEYAELVRNAEVLIVDDVYTTGATAECCAEALRRADARRVYFAAYAYAGGDKHG